MKYLLLILFVLSAGCLTQLFSESYFVLPPVHSTASTCYLILPQQRDIPIFMNRWVIRNHDGVKEGCIFYAIDMFTTSVICNLPFSVICEERL